MSGIPPINDLLATLDGSWDPARRNFQRKIACWPSTVLRMRRWTPCRWPQRPVGRDRDAFLPPTARRPVHGSGAQHRAGGHGRSAAMADRIVWNRLRDTMTSASWNVIERPCGTILAP